jgi:hypothetical protein
MESGETNARVNFPKPCDVQIDVVDDATGAPVFVQHYSWEPLDDADATTSSSTFFSSEIGRTFAEIPLPGRTDPALDPRRQTHRSTGDSNSLRPATTARSGSRGTAVSTCAGCRERSPRSPILITGSRSAIAPDGSATEVDLDDWLSE